MERKNFIIYNRTNRSERTYRPTISVNSEKGIIYLSKELCGAMELLPGDRVSFLQDKDNPKDWYIYYDADDGYKLKARDSRNTMMLFSKSITRAIMLIITTETPSPRILVSTTPIQDDAGRDLFPILTSSAH